MTDLPQHLAVASILWNIDDPRFGFAAFYEVAWDRSLYVLPYLVAMALAPFASLEAGMRVVVVLSLASLPIGVFALLRALGKPEWLALLALPLVYNRAFFWGFVNFQLALGFALLALAILVRPPRGCGFGARARRALRADRLHASLRPLDARRLRLRCGSCSASAARSRATRSGSRRSLLGVLVWGLLRRRPPGTPRASRSRRCSSASTISRSPCWAAIATRPRRT